MTINELKLMIYESAINNDDKINLIEMLKYADDQTEIYLVESVSELFYVTEKKARADYRIDKFKKRYQYDPKTKTVLVDPNKPDGERQKIDIKSGGTNSKNWKNSDQLDDVGYDPFSDTVRMTRKVFNMSNPKTHEFAYNHEIGHSEEGKNPKEANKRIDDVYDSKEFNKAEAKYDKFSRSRKSQDMVHDHTVDPTERAADRYAVKHTPNGLKVLKSMSKDFTKFSDKEPTAKFVGKYEKELHKQEKLKTEDEKNYQKLPPMNKIKYMASHAEDIADANQKIDDAKSDLNIVKKQPEKWHKAFKGADRYDASMRYKVQKELAENK